MTISAECPVCGRPQGQGILDDACTTRLERDLGDVAAIVEDLSITLSKQSRIGSSGGAGLARERSPLNVGAMNAGDNLANTLSTWARDVCTDVPAAAPGKGAAVTAAWALLSNIPAVRKHPAVEELVDEISDAIRQARRVVDRPADRIYLGQCHFIEAEVECLAELYASPGASEVRCRGCGVTHPVLERRVWLLERARELLFTVREAAQMVGDVGGITITEDRIRGYLRRGRLVDHPLGGKRGIRLGDLLDIVVSEGNKKSA